MNQVPKKKDIDWEDINRPAQEPWNMAPPVAEPKATRRMGNVTKTQFPKVMRSVRIRALIGDLLLSPGFLITAFTVGMLTLLLLVR